VGKQVCKGLQRLFRCTL